MEALHAPAKWDMQATVLVVKVRLIKGGHLRFVTEGKRSTVENVVHYV